MKFYITRRGGIIKGGSSSSSTTSTSTTTSTTKRRFATLCLPTVLIIIGIILPFLFIRTAFLALDSVSSCSSLDCVGWKLGPRIFGGSSSDLSLKLANELTRALIEENEKEEEKVDVEEEGTGIDGFRPGTFNDLVADIISNSKGQGSNNNNNNNNNMKVFASKTKAMLLRMESRIKLARQQESMYRQLASYGVPKPMHCLGLRLAEEYSSNALARSPLPQPEFVYRLIDTSYHHFALLTDNILAASVVVSSTVINSAHPEKLVFHILTDKQTYAPMHAWFALNPVALSVVEVKGLHQFDWPVEVNVKIKEMLEIHRSIYIHYKYLKKQKQGNDGFRLNCYSLVNQLRIFLPELFPELDKIVYLDDDIVVQKDLSPLWELDLNGKVNGAVVSSWAGKVKKEREFDCPAGKLYGNYLNFSNPKVSEEFEYDRCAWLDGMNVFDLNAWRKTNITNTYHSWLKHNLNSAFTLWHPGVLPPSLIAFEGQVHPLDPAWHVAGLGDQKRPELRQEILEAAAVVHFSGPAKPWLEIGHAELRRLWYVHVNYSNEFIESCNIIKEY